VLFTNTDLASATIASERLLEGIRSHRHADDLGVSFLVTTSGGLARRETWDETPRDLLARADHALYQAKAAGRDRVVAATGRGAPRDPDGSAAEEPSRGRA
jgi:PleD family two-component response regulator